MTMPNEIKLRSTVENIIYYYFILFLGFETLNGFSIYAKIGAGESFVAGLKIIAFLLLFIFFVTANRRNLFWGVSLVFLIGFLLLMQAVLYPEGPSSATGRAAESFESATLKTLQLSIKISMNFLAVFFLRELFLSNKINKIKNIAFFNFGFLFANIIIAALGFGFGNYKNADGESFGGTGFFFAGNEVGIALLMGLLSLLLLSKSRYGVMLVAVLGLVSASFILSKTAIFGSLILLASYLYSRSKGYFVLACSAVLGFFVFYWGRILSYYEMAVNRWLYFIDRSGFVTFLLGGEKRVQESLGVIATIEDDFSTLLFGHGWSGYSENNFFDLLQMFGLFGLFVFFFWTYVVLSGWTKYFSLNKANFQNESIFVFKASVIVSLLILAVSVIAGHTIQSSLILPFVGFLFIKRISLINRVL